jgi:hypothetical protein
MLCVISTTSHAQDHADVFTCGLFTRMQDCHPPSEAGQVPLSRSITGLFPRTAHLSPLCPSPDHGDNGFLCGSPSIPSEVVILPTGVGIVLDRRVEIFLQKFKGLFEIFALANSKVGLKKVKFHAPKHATRYIKRYGSSTNYFGGTLESCLKPTVKWPSELTSQ